MAVPGTPSSSFKFTLKVTKFSVKATFVIENLAYYRVMSNISYEPLESPPFYAPEHDLQFKIFFYPNGTVNVQKPLLNKFTAACVQVKTISGGDGGSGGQGAGGDEVVTKSEFWKEDAVIAVDFLIAATTEEKDGGENVNSMHYRGEYSFEVNSPCLLPIEYADCCGFPEFFDGGKLVLEAEIKVSYPTDAFSGIFCPLSPEIVLNVAQSGSAHFKRMKALLEHGGANSDATLVASDGQEFKVHQFPLSTHSPVFAAIFGQDQKQKKKKKTTTRKSVQIEVDASAEAVRTLLHYIYLGTVASKEELTVELLSAADKFQVDDLKLACERHLLRQLTTESVFPLLVQADLHGVPSLKESCIKYVLFHSPLLTTAAWKKFISAVRPKLFAEVVIRVALNGID